MTCDMCKDCVFWVMAKCDGLQKPETCLDRETYQDWDNLDSCINEF